MNYISSFNKGLEPIINKIFQEEFSYIDTYSIQEGFVIYKCETKVETNNNLLFISTYEIHSYNKHNIKPKVQGLLFYIGNGKYRVVDYNTLDNTIYNTELDLIENSYYLLYDNCEYRLEKLNSNIHEFNDAYNEMPLKGLPLPIVYCMNYLSEISAYDKYIDPFCGSGILPYIRAEMGEYHQISAIDISDHRYVFDDIFFNKENFFEHKIKYNYDKIVTDPPWNNHVKVDNVITFYDDFFAKILMISNIEAVYVFITTQKRLIKDLCVKYELQILEQYEVKVNAIEATIFKICRISKKSFAQ